MQAARTQVRRVYGMLRYANPAERNVRLKPMRMLCLSLLLAATTLASLAQTPLQHPTSTPYAGDLNIFETPGRAERLHIDRVMDIMRITPGKTVADIGAGGGWFSVLAAKRVGPTGTVLAEDINPLYIEAINKRAATEHLPNIKAILGTPGDPRLPPNSVDAVMMLKVYHEIAHPQTVLAALYVAMRSGARFGIIDRNGKGDDHGLAEKTAREEVERAGFRQVARHDFTKDDGQDYFLVFEKR